MKKILSTLSFFSLLAAQSHALEKATFYKCDGTNLSLEFVQVWNADGSANRESTKLKLTANDTTTTFSNVSTTVSAMGLVVSVVEGVAADHTSSRSVIIPLVHVEKESDRPTFKSVLVSTTSKTSEQGPGAVVGVVQENTYSKLTCKARLSAPAPAPTPAPNPAPVPAPATLN